MTTFSVATRKNKHPALHVGNAIARVLAEETPIAKAYSVVHAFYKAEPVADDEDDEEDERDGDDTDALAELEQLAEQERRRENGMSKAQAFTKIYTDPSNAALVRRERRQSLTKMMAR